MAKETGGLSKSHTDPDLEDEGREQPREKRGTVRAPFWLEPSPGKHAPKYRIPRLPGRLEGRPGERVEPWKKPREQEKTSPVIIVWSAALVRPDSAGKQARGSV